MTQILHSASYFWNDAPLPDAHDAMLRALPESVDERTAAAAMRIWELLETPQTVETLCRVLHRELHVETETCNHDIQIVLSGLLREDLIQLSPDT